MHQLKSTLNHYGEPSLTLVVAREQEALNLEKIAAFRGFGVETSAEGDHHNVTLFFDGSNHNGSSASCGS